MNSKILGAGAIATIAALVGCGGHSSLIPNQPAQTSSVSDATRLMHLRISNTERILRAGCGPAAPGRLRCFLDAPHPVYAPIASGVRPDASCTLDQPPCYGPSGLRSAYNVSTIASTAGKGMTVAVIDAYGYPTAKSDLQLYRRELGLPKLCAKCFTIVGENGGSPPSGAPPSGSNGGWDVEQALDVDMVSAVCPKCHILLFEANSPSSSDLYPAVATALTMADVVSVSWGGYELVATYPLFDQHPDHVIVASAGDDGYGVAQPCTFAGVVCVGGTSLTPSSSSASGWSEAAWSGTGSGCSAYVKKPKWQRILNRRMRRGCRMRVADDLSADADPSTGVLIAFNGVCCYGAIGGTSAAAPLVAGLFALAGNPKKATPARLWRHGGTSAFTDVTQGSNGTCPSKALYLCEAGKGYDGPTGWGTPNGITAL